MNSEDMILVSIDDHMVEPPDMYTNHVPAKWLDDAPKVVRNESGVDEWVFQGESDLDAVRHGGDRRLATRAVGIQPGRLLRTAPGLLRRPRAGEGHERQRRAGVHVLPDDGRLQRPHLHRVPRQGHLRSSCSRRTTTGRIDEWCGAYPAASSPSASSRCGTSTWR